MKDRRKLLLIGAVVVGVLVVGGGIAIASAGDDDRPLTGKTLDQATRAALEHTGGGTVIETEVGDDGAAYGVEIRLDGGDVVEVILDEGFTVIGSDADEDAPSEDDGIDD